MELTRVFRKNKRHQRILACGQREAEKRAAEETRASKLKAKAESAECKAQAAEREAQAARVVVLEAVSGLEKAAASEVSA
jgi:hypothetical protein